MRRNRIENLAIVLGVIAAIVVALARPYMDTPTRHNQPVGAVRG